MPTNWDDMEKAAREGGGGAWNRQADDGDTDVLAVLDDGSYGDVHRPDHGPGSRAIPCAGSTTCRHCDAGVKKQRKFVFSVWSENARDVQIREDSKQAALGLVACLKKHGANNLFRVRRRGRRSDPRTVYDWTLERAMTPEEQAKLARVTLYDLVTYLKNGALRRIPRPSTSATPPTPSTPPAPPTSDDLPF